MSHLLRQNCEKSHDKSHGTERICHTKLTLDDMALGCLGATVLYCRGIGEDQSTKLWLNIVSHGASKKEGVVKRNKSTAVVRQTQQAACTALTAVHLPWWQAGCDVSARNNAQSTRRLQATATPDSWPQRVTTSSPAGKRVSRLPRPGVRKSRDFVRRKQRQTAEGAWIDQVGTNWNCRRQDDSPNFLVLAGRGLFWKINSIWAR